jgi:hypothetical protein
MRSSVNLTKAQQDAWNAHQAARLQASNNQSITISPSGSRTTDPARVFGGVESLIEESQDWWLKDQSALAMGFNNWVDPGTGRSVAPAEWSMMGYSIPTTMDGNDGNVYGYDVNDYSGYRGQSG